MLAVVCPAGIAKPATSGSCRTMSAICSMRPVIALNDESCDDSTKPNTKPVSCCGKKPFGIQTNIRTVSASVAKNTASVARECRNTKSSPRL